MRMMPIAMHGINGNSLIYIEMNGARIRIHTPRNIAHKRKQTITNVIDYIQYDIFYTY